MADKSDTPRSDRETLSWNLSASGMKDALKKHSLGISGENINGRVVLADFARTLERELAAAQAQLQNGTAEYEGKSIRAWKDKADAYGKACMGAWDVLAEFGIKADGNTHFHDGIRALARREQSAKDELLVALREANDGLVEEERRIHKDAEDWHEPALFGKADGLQYAIEKIDALITKHGA